MKWENAISLSGDHNDDDVLYRQVPLWETIEVARYLANLFSCDTESLPTELLIHSYWKLMPEQFSAAKPYVRCLWTRAGMFKSAACHSLNPYYCGRRFGEHADLRRLNVCRQMLTGNETDAKHTGAPPPVAAKTRTYRSCLAGIRSTV